MTRPLRETLGRLAAVAAVCLPSLMILMPLARAIAWAFVLSFLLYPVYHRIRRGFSRISGREMLSAAALVSTIVGICLVAIPVTAFLFLSAREAGRFISHNDVAGIARALSDALSESGATEWLRDIDLAPLMDSQAAGVLAEWAGRIASVSARVSKNTMAFLGSSVFNLVVVSTTTFFFLRDGRRVSNYLLHSLMSIEGERALGLEENILRMTRGVLYGYALTAVIQGGVAGIGWWIAGLGRTYLATVVMIFLSFIPFVGATFLLCCAIVYLYLNAAYGSALILAIWTCGVTLIDNFIRPKFVADESKVHTFPVFIGIIGGLAAWGPVGIFVGPVLLLSVPILLESLSEKEPFSESY